MHSALWFSCALYSRVVCKCMSDVTLLGLSADQLEKRQCSDDSATVAIFAMESNNNLVQRLGVS